MDADGNRNVATDNSGRWFVSNLSSGRVKIAVNFTGFKQLVAQINYDGSRPVSTSYVLNLAAATETVELSVNGRNYSNLETLQPGLRKNAAKQQMPASSNVTSSCQRNTNHSTICWARAVWSVQSRA